MSAAAPETIIDDEAEEARSEAAHQADAIRATIDDERPTPADVDGLVW